MKKPARKLYDPLGDPKNRTSPASPWLSFHEQIDKPDVAAIKALAVGLANEGQQIRAINLIVHVLSGYYSTSFRPGVDGARATDFAEGKRYVGAAIAGIVNMPFPD